ncbi:MAG: hypothetical protein EZS28_014249 [Streblomastix strix]|uniref:Uncharacterized protein n=1 Tax=Streblomastix strix TaxID=222440 RepID=A0A5J4W6T8_9EUKA|nr:MAG: hypothetical protein EZS28_014249 [Streblomastix strix]
MNNQIGINNRYSNDEQLGEGQGTDRIYSIDFPVSGLSSLLSRMYLYIDQISKMDIDDILISDVYMQQFGGGNSSGIGPIGGSSQYSQNQTNQKGRGNTNDQIRYMVSAIRNDLNDGLKQITELIMQSGVSTIELSKSVLIYSVIGCSVIQLFMVVINAIPWSQDVVRATLHSRKLLMLLPTGGRGKGDEKVEKEMALLSSMRTGYPLLDKGREHIVESALVLIDGIKSQEPTSQLLSFHSNLIQIVYKQFTDEEREMIQRKYKGSRNVKGKDILLAGSGDMSTNAENWLIQSVDKYKNFDNYIDTDGDEDDDDEGKKNKQKIGNNAKIGDNQMQQQEQQMDEQQLMQQQQALLQKQQQEEEDKQQQSLADKQKQAQLINTVNDPAQHNFKTHAKEHIILRQRLTVIGDLLKIQNDSGASKMIAKRNLIKLFDGHFTNADMCFGNTIPKDEKEDVKNDQLSNKNDDSQLMGNKDEGNLNDGW